MSETDMRGANLREVVLTKAYALKADLSGAPCPPRPPPRCAAPFPCAPLCGTCACGWTPPCFDVELGGDQAGGWAAQQRRSPLLAPINPLPPDMCRPHVRAPRRRRPDQRRD